MKSTSRDNWRVVATFNPRQTHVSIASLGFKDQWGDPLEGELHGPPIEFVIHPRRLGDLGFMSMSDSLASRDIEGDYRKACWAIKTAMLRHPNVTEARVVCDEEHTCSFCGSGWDVLDADSLVDLGQDEHSIVGEPACCEEAMDEFRAERKIPLLLDGVVAFRNPDRPGLLMCRAHGKAWGMTPLKADDLPDGGICGYGDPATPDVVCGVDVLIPQKAT